MQYKASPILKHKSMDSFPGIEELRKARTGQQYLSALNSNLTNHNPRSITTTGTDNAPHPIVIAWLNDVDADEIFLNPKAGLFEMTKFYFTMGSTSLGPLPFETFILDKWITRYDLTNPEEFFKMHVRDIPYASELIIDTYNFITTGRRDINLDILYSMAQLHAENHDCYDSGIKVPELNVKQRFKWCDLKNLSSQEFFIKWVSQPYGLEDLKGSYKLLLGY